MNKLVDQYNNTYHCSIGKKPVTADYPALTKDIESSYKFKVGDRVRITKYKNIFSKDYTENWWRDIFLTDSALETNPRTYKIKYWNDEKIKKIGSFYEKELLLSKL